MADDDLNDARVVEYLRLAAEMRAKADEVFDPRVAAEYLALATKWLRLAEENSRSTRQAEARPRVTDVGGRSDIRDT